jgi:hypothetical protein
MYPRLLSIVKQPWQRLAQEAQATERRKTRRTPAIETAWLAWIVLALALFAGGPAFGADNGADPVASFSLPQRPVVCQDQTYALCAGARCLVFNDVAYCSCGVKKGNSVSAPFNYDNTNVCRVNADGVNNGYMVSTFSLPESLRAPYGRQALYVCPRTSTASYAKCDGGICFTSTQGMSFPGLGMQASNEIVCSCPIETANAVQGLEIIGPFPCEQSFFRNCESAVANNKTGTTLYDGTAIGSTVIGTYVLNGRVPPLNTCRK